ncbi:39S ribosomal protein L46, mitochondrial [Camponotus floridanus]|uniref:39S ribosomal protein L46, mitochondrial n=1 Tax=Camponotus floridanus TaxID=104421 RepID=E1ZX80_CAMFO|nr:39S ribosomal protein L46, mitochondrial [Camponotus floridanus]
MFFKQAVKLPTLYNSCQILSGISGKAATIYLNVVQCQDTRAFSSAASIRKWDLYSAVCLERHPVIIQPMQEIELKFYNMLKKIEFKKSLKCDHELRVEKEEKQKKSKDASTKEKDVNKKISIQTAQDFEDNCQEEFNSFKFAPTVTSDTYYWIPPQGIRKEGETMRQTAERVLQDTCGTNIKANFYGNAPIGFYKYKYPKELNDQGIYGAKIFYFLAKYLDGNVTNDIKYQWLDDTEFKKILPHGIQKSISQFMLFT